MSNVPQHIQDSILADDETLKPGFCGIGRFRGRNDYTPDERTVLEYFFTNIDSNVGCAKDTLPNELWALLLGQYARSNLTVPERLLKLFYTVHEKNGKAVSLPQLADLIRQQGNVGGSLEAHCQKAGAFIVEWGIDYGHASLRDSGTIRMYCEGVSQRVTKFLEADRLGAYQEQSTRALPFEKENLGMPYEIRGTTLEHRLLAMDELLIRWYDSAYAKLLPYIDSKYAHLRKEADEQIAQELGRTDVKLSDTVWRGVVKAKAFDIARYLLPQNMTTSLGITLNTRRFQEQLTLWQSNPIWEMQVLGKAAQIEAMKLNPSLMKYGNPSAYYRTLPEKRRALFEKFAAMPKEKSSFDYKHYDVQSRLIAVTPDIEDWALASILFNGSDGSLSMAEIKNAVTRLSKAQRREIAQTFLDGRLSHEEYPKDLEIGTFTFERLYDIGAYRDLQRQRGDRQQCMPYSIIGYNMPSEFGEIGMEMHFLQAMWHVKDMYDLFIQKGYAYAAEYVPVMANMVRHVATHDPIQNFYEAKLRTQPAGIDSYRTIKQQETKIALEHMPAFQGLIVVDNKHYPLGRLPEAVKRVIKRARNKK